MKHSPVAARVIEMLPLLAALNVHAVADGRLLIALPLQALLGLVALKNFQTQHSSDAMLVCGGALTALTGESEEWDTRATQWLVITDIGITSYSGQDGLHETVVTARNRRGRDIRCRVTCSQLRAPDGEVRGVIVLMNDKASD